MRKNSTVSSWTIENIRSFCSKLWTTTSRNVIYSTLSQISDSVISLSQYIIIGRILGPDGLGFWSSILSLAVIVASFLNLGLHVPLGRETAQKSEQANTLLGSSIIIVLFISSPLVMLFAFFVSWWIGYDFKSYIALTLALAGISIGNLSTLGFAVLQAKDRFDLVLVGKTVGRITVPLLLLSFLPVNSSVHLIFLVTMCSSIVSLLSAYIALKQIHVSANYKIELNLLSRLIMEALPITFTSIMITVGLRADSIILERTVSATEAGYYSAAYSIFILGSALLHSVTVGIFPTFARVSQRQKSDHVYHSSGELRDVYLQFSILLFLAACCGAAIVWLMAPTLILGVFGEKYVESITFARILAVGFPFIAVSRTAMQLLNSSRNQRLSFIAFFVGAVFNVLANLLLTPQLGGFSASVISVLTEAIVGVLIVWFAWNKLRRIWG